MRRDRGGHARCPKSDDDDIGFHVPPMWHGGLLLHVVFLLPGSARGSVRPTPVGAISSLIGVSKRHSCWEIDTTIEFRRAILPPIPSYLAPPRPRSTLMADGVAQRSDRL
jgi:hypothetical protein